jgi:hypothetical protein
MHWVMGVLTPRVKRAGAGTDHSTPSSVEDKNAWSYASTPPISLHASSWCGAYLNIGTTLPLFYFTYNLDVDTRTEHGVTTC